MKNVYKYDYVTKEIVAGKFLEAGDWFLHKNCVKTLYNVEEYDKNVWFDSKYELCLRNNFRKPIKDINILKRVLIYIKYRIL